MNDSPHELSAASLGAVDHCARRVEVLGRDDWK